MFIPSGEDFDYDFESWHPPTRNYNEAEKEKARADALEVELIEANKKIIRVQNWRIAASIVAIIAMIVAMVYINRYGDMDGEYNFYHKHASIVTENGNYYHRFDCDKVTADGIYILNTEYAESLGYEPCKYCWDE